MSLGGKTIAKNVGVLMSSQLLSWGLTILVTVFLPRYLGATAIGQFYLAGALWGIVGTLVGFGMDTHLTKEISRNQSVASDLLGTSLLLRGLLFIAGCGAVAVYVILTDHSPATVAIIVLVGVAQLLSVFGNAFTAALQGFEVMEYVSLASILTKTVNTVLCLVVVFLGLGVFSVATVGIIAAAVGLLTLFIALQRRYRLRLRVNPGHGLAMLKASSPYLVVGLVLAAYQQINTLIIASVLNEEAVGWYSSASTLYGTLLFVPVVFATAVFPAISRTYSSATNAVPQLIRRSVDVMLLVGIPMGFGIMIVCENLVALLYGDGFAPTGVILGVMGVGLVFTFLNILYGQLLVATDRPSVWTKIMIIAAVVMFLLASVLVPWSQQIFGIGAVGGALSFLLTELAMTIAGTLLLPRGLLGWRNVRTAALTLLASLVMVLASWPFRAMLLPIPVGIGAVVFLGMALFLRVVQAEDLNFFRQIYLQLKRRNRPGAQDPVGVNGG